MSRSSSRLKTMLMALVVFVTVGWTAADAEAGESSWSIGFGALVGIEPDATFDDARAAFALTPQSEWQIVDLFWFAWGSRLAVNGKYFGWAMLPGFLFKIDAGYNLFPTLRAQFMFASLTSFDDWSYFPVYLGASFGPGLRYKFDALSIFVDLGFEVAREIRYAGKALYFSIVPVFGLEF